MPDGLAIRGGFSAALALLPQPCPVIEEVLGQVWTENAERLEDCVEVSRSQRADAARAWADARHAALSGPT